MSYHVYAYFEFKIALKKALQKVLSVNSKNKKLEFNK